MNEYEGVRRVVYDPDGATFVPVCSKCGRFVRADKTVTMTYKHGWEDKPNSDCARCGRVSMLFEGCL